MYSRAECGDEVGWPVMTQALCLLYSRNAKTLEAKRQANWSVITDQGVIRQIYP